MKSPLKPPLKRRSALRTVTLPLATALGIMTRPDPLNRSSEPESRFPKRLLIKKEVKMIQKLAVLILPAGIDCNLSCSYCYHSGVRKRNVPMEIMSLEVLREAMDGSRDIAPNIDFLYHGGEPMLAGLDFYQKTLDIQRKLEFRGKARNILQTNGVLINDSWVNFIVKNGFFISVSLDGPENLHNKNRYMINCRGIKSGTHSLVKNGIQKMIARGRQVGAIAVITTINVNYPAEVYQALKSSGVRTCVFHLYSKDEGAQNNDLAPTDEAASSFFKQVFDLWFKEDNPSFMIRNFRNVVRVFFGGKALDCASNYNYCRRFIAVAPNGDVYPCHRFVGRNDFKIGNVLERRLSVIYKQNADMYEEMATIPQKCFSCRWFKLCGGGCSYERFVANGKFQSTHPECNVKQQLFFYINNAIKKAGFRDDR
ncbi:MAG: radical SAM protein [Patescibacteria group bacterium]